MSKPSFGLLVSMAIRYDHALAIPNFYDSIDGPGSHANRMKSTLRVMEQLYEEVSGQGFYNTEKEEYYANLGKQLLNEES